MEELESAREEKNSVVCIEEDIECEQELIVVEDRMEEQQEIRVCMQECECCCEQQVEALHCYECACDEENIYNLYENRKEMIAVQNSEETESPIANDSSLYLASSEGDNDSDDSDHSEIKLCEADVEKQGTVNSDKSAENAEIIEKKIEHEEREEQEQEEEEEGKANVMQAEEANTPNAKTVTGSEELPNKDSAERITEGGNECKSVISSLPLFDNISSEKTKVGVISSQSAHSSPGMTEDEQAEMSSSSACHSGIFAYNDSLSFPRRSESFAGSYGSSSSSSSNRYHHRRTHYTQHEQIHCYPEYGCCVFFFPSPVLSWLFPLAGHVGITNAEGSMLYTFESPYFVREERLSDVLDEIIFQEVKEQEKEHASQDEHNKVEPLPQHLEREPEQSSKYADIANIEQTIHEDKPELSTIVPELSPLSSTTTTTTTSSTATATIKCERRKCSPREQFAGKKSNNFTEHHRHSEVSNSAINKQEQQSKSESSNLGVNTKLSLTSKGTNNFDTPSSSCEAQERVHTHKEVREGAHQSYLLASASSPVSEVIADACKMSTSLFTEKSVSDTQSASTNKTETITSLASSLPSDYSSSSSCCCSSPLLSAERKSPFSFLTGMKKTLSKFVCPLSWKNSNKSKLTEAEQAIHKSHSKRKGTKHLGHSHCHCVSVWDLKSLLMESDKPKSFVHHSHFSTAVWNRLQELLQGLDGHDDVFHLRRRSSEGDDPSDNYSHDIDNSSSSYNSANTRKNKEIKKTKAPSRNISLKLDDRTALLYNRNLQASIKLFRASADGANDTPELLIHQHYSFSLVAFVLEACGVGQRRQHSKDASSCTNNNNSNSSNVIYNLDTTSNKSSESNANQKSSNVVQHLDEATGRTKSKVVSISDETDSCEANHSNNSASITSLIDSEQTGSLSSDADEEIYWGVPKLLYHIWRYGKWHRTGYLPRRWIHGGNCFIAAALWVVLIAVCTQYLYMWYLIWRNPVQEIATAAVALASESVSLSTAPSSISSITSTSSSPVSV